ncbi:hypothetical protein ACEPPN_014102 [Leptodophora sp. 'Broadleaf-Isolate-01']
MQFKSLVVFTTLMVGVFAAPSPAELEFRALCKSPKCKAFCEDGTAYDCCVDYIRDPCWGHYLPEAEK